MRIGSLFSGIGGLEMGLLAAIPGSTVAWQAEAAEYPKAVLRARFPDVKLYEDVRLINETAERVDIICGGFPCQDISNAGKRAGITGEKSGLWSEYVRILRALRPRYVFVENVSALVIRGLDRVLCDLAELGYDAEWATLYAANVGAPHRRRRLFILAYANGESIRRQDNGGREGESREDGPPWIVADANRAWELQPGGVEREQWRWSAHGDRWAFESPVCGVAHGVPARKHRLTALGNAVVPQQAAYAWKALIERTRT